ncbi:ABC transporter ATP-binding protein [Oligoflexus tunisiensis]|uniref:ABC transporter ATP-binding protein n=1 Tax=Oligoflexus tunisiensis TaxID=708132 RepID=UPI000A3E5ABD|nr:ATP-binding cassette domain-containing protein [Oligoflexus tunisiensis]
MIEVKQLKKSFGKVEAVRSVSFQAEDGQITGLLGDNGAGKTTTIRMLAGTLTPDAGLITLDQQPLAIYDRRQRRSIGILSDAKGLYERLTTRENMAYYGQLMGISGSALDQGIERARKLLDLDDILERRVQGFSTGQRMKVLLGRLLVYQPKNLILDEPSAGLDVRATRKLRLILSRLRDEGHCLVFSSHIMQEVEMLCDSVIIVHDGRSLGQAPVAEWNLRAGAEKFEDAFVAALEGGQHVP